MFSLPLNLICNKPTDKNGTLPLCAIEPKHESRGLSIERLVISLYAKGMSVSAFQDSISRSGDMIEYLEDGTARIKL